MEFRFSEAGTPFFCNLLSELNKKHIFFPKKSLDIVCVRGYIMAKMPVFRCFELRYNRFTPYKQFNQRLT